MKAFSADQREFMRRLYRDGVRQLGMGVGGRAVNSLLDEDPPLLLRIARARTFSFDAFDEHMLDLDDFEALAWSAPTYAPSATTRNQVLVHVLVEYVFARRNSAGFDESHAAGNWAELVYRQERGQQGRPNDYMRHIGFPGLGFKVIEYSNGAKTVLPITGTSFGAPIYSEPGK